MGRGLFLFYDKAVQTDERRQTMWIKINPNPAKKETGDCVVRAIATATGQSWLKVYDALYEVGREECDLMNADAVWGLYLYRLGFEPFLLPDACPECVTVREFCKRFPRGIYIIGTGNHAVAVLDGDYYDSWDSGKTVPSYFWRIK